MTSLLLHEHNKIVFDQIPPISVCFVIVFPSNVSGKKRRKFEQKMTKHWGN